MSTAPGDACALLITCEHGGNRIPPRYRDCFAGHEALLASHRGYDPGALAMARELSHALAAPLIYATTSRLLVDLNRSPGHPRLYSEMIRRQPEALRREIFESHYLPFRTRAEGIIARAVEEGRRVVHVSSHSFTPVLDGVVRRADVGLLYDPARPGEAALCRAWLASLRRHAPELRLRRNYPYTGKSDGFTAYLRRRFDADRYIGVELEINQGLVGAPRDAWRRLRTELVASLLQALDRPRAA
ncbi:N-formylglutamate amidohydrolase [Azoarcus sp. KH32C]|uniref:N-formylglutamate amidohydrolase n=1 Tax=Azoarcus sp. KH32C TaxID=748247 RepID=UPI0002386C5B|nr:N-formylglutamate amidohydrolase [Azoarcus sp. KH32C]BAL23863.1 N-formylglutamate amidohydrolase [Azoarcus sp. KH32C]